MGVLLSWGYLSGGPSILGLFEWGGSFILGLCVLECDLDTPSNGTHAISWYSYLNQCISNVFKVNKDGRNPHAHNFSVFTHLHNIIIFLPGTPAHAVQSILCSIIEIYQELVTLDRKL